MNMNFDLSKLSLASIKNQFDEVIKFFFFSFFLSGRRHVDSKLLLSALTNYPSFIVGSSSSLPEE